MSRYYYPQSYYPHSVSPAPYYPPSDYPPLVRPIAPTPALTPLEKIKVRSACLRICRECPLREFQTCTRNNRSCYDNANESFCPAALFGRTHGTWPSGYFNEPLYRETLAAAPPEPDPFVGEPIVHFGAHLWPVIYSDEPKRPWVKQIALWHELAEQINGRLIVGVATGPNTATFAEIEEYFGEKFELFEIPNDEIEGENPTFRELLQRLPSGPDDVLIYCHGKGVQSPRRNAEAIKLWVELLYETVVFNWRTGLEKLASGYKSFGSFRSFTTARNIIPHGWYYSGTFFIGRLKHFHYETQIVSIDAGVRGPMTMCTVTGRTPLPVTPIWGGVEHFLGTHFRASECWCDFADGRDMEQEYHMSRMFPAICHDSLHWSAERLRQRCGVRCEQHEQELDWFINQLHPTDRVLVIGSRSGGLESLLKARHPTIATVSIDPEPMPDNEHSLIIGSSHDDEVQLQARALGPYDVVFVDGDHTLDGVTQDWEFAKKLKPRLVAFHDITDTTFHRSLDCHVALLWAEIQKTYHTNEKIVGGGWGGIGVVYLQETIRALTADREPIDVSIIVTVGKGYEWIAPKAVESAHAQATDQIRCEVIVVWDGFETPPEEVRANRARNKGVQFHNVQQARRAGLEMARGRYTLFLDADDWLPKGFVESAVQQLIAAHTLDHRVVGIYPSAEYVDLATGAIQERVTAPAWDQLRFESQNFVVISTLIYTEDLRLANWGSSPNEVLEDHQMWSSVIARGVRLAPGTDLTLRVGVHPDSLTESVVHKDYSALYAIADQPITVVLIVRSVKRIHAIIDWLAELPENVRLELVDYTGSMLFLLDNSIQHKRPDNRVRSMPEVFEPAHITEIIQEINTPFVWLLDDEILPQLSAVDALQELAAGFEADVGAVCGLTGSRSIAPDQRFASTSGSGFSCVLARTRVMQAAGPIYQPTAPEPWPDARFWSRFSTGAYRIRVANRVPCAHVDRQLEILTYHEVDPVNPSTWSITPELLRAHLTWLRDNGWRFTTLDDALLSYGPAGKQVVITFDDGRLGCWEHAKPILDEFGIKATFFICPQMTDGDAAVNQRYTDFMTWRQVIDLQQEGHTIGNHSHEHDRLDHMTRGDLWDQVARANTVIEGVLQIEEPSCELVHYAPPYGSTSPHLVEIIKSSGYRTICTTEERGNPLPIDPFDLGRRQITNGTTVEQLAAMLGGGK